MVNIFILEDNSERIRWFVEKFGENNDLTIAIAAKQAITILDLDIKFVYIYLNRLIQNLKLLFTV
jgi:hypothetical protein